MLHRNIVLVISLAFIIEQSAGQNAKPNLTGSWRLDPAKSEIPSKSTAGMVLTIEQKANSIHVVRTTTGGDGKEKKLEFNCTTDGKECAVEGDKISLWFNGAVLVLMDVGSDVVTQSNLKLGPDGKSVTVEEQHIAPQAETDKLVLAKT